MGLMVYTDQYGQVCVVDDAKVFPNNLILKTLDTGTAGKLSDITERFNKMADAYRELRNVVSKYDMALNSLRGQEVMHFMHLMHDDRCQCVRITDCRFGPRQRPAKIIRKQLTKKQRRANQSFARFISVQREKRRRKIK